MEQVVLPVERFAAQIPKKDQQQEVLRRASRLAIPVEEGLHIQAAEEAEELHIHAAEAEELRIPAVEEEELHTPAVAEWEGLHTPAAGQVVDHIQHKDWIAAAQEPARPCWDLHLQELGTPTDRHTGQLLLVEVVQGRHRCRWEDQMMELQDIQVEMLALQSFDQKAVEGLHIQAEERALQSFDQKAVEGLHIQAEERELQSFDQKAVEGLHIQAEERELQTYF